MNEIKDTFNEATTSVTSLASLDQLILSQITFLACAGRDEYGLTEEQKQHLLDRYNMIVNAHPEVLEQAYYVTNDWKEPCDSALNHFAIKLQVKVLKKLDFVQQVPLEMHLIEIYLLMGLERSWVLRLKLFQVRKRQSFHLLAQQKS